MIRFIIHLLFGVTAGFLTSMISVLHYEKCSDNCQDLIFKRIAIYSLLSLFLYLLIYFICKIKKITNRENILINFLIFTTIISSSLAINRNDMEDEIHYLKNKADVSTDFNFMYMSILTKNGVVAYSKDNKFGGTLNLKQWERCAIDGAFCESGEKKAHMKCKSGEVYVKEQDWDKFKLIPEENLSGAEPIKSMNLCEKK